MAEYTVSRGLYDEAAFEWWVPYILRKQYVIISAINSRYKATTHKYGIEVPRTIEEALRLDQKNGDTKWTDATKKEMANVSMVFEIQPGYVLKAPDDPGGTGSRGTAPRGTR